MTDYTLENSILSSIQRAKEKAEIELKFSTHEKPHNILERMMNLEFEKINCLHISHDKKKIIRIYKKC